MPSEIDVINYALIKLGQNPIISLTDDTPVASTVGLIYPLVRDQLQRLFPWRSCKARKQLAASTETPEWGYGYKYPVPADNLRIIDVYGGSGEPYHRLGNTEGPFPRSLWSYENGEILTDIQGPINIIYLKRVTDPNEWDSLQVSAMSAFLAMELAEPLTNSPQKRSQAAAWFQEIMAAAKNASAQEGNPAIMNPDSKWEQARWDGGGNT